MNYPKPRFIEVHIPMNPAQKHLHDVLASAALRDFGHVRDFDWSHTLRIFSNRVTQLIKLASNPMLLASDESFRHDALLGEAIAEGPSPKIAAACAHARRLAKTGVKSIVWTAFPQNVESVAEHLLELRPAVVRAGSPGDSRSVQRSQEQVLRIRDERDCMVMVASAGATEVGVSQPGLPWTCNHAIYVDRSYNLRRFLSSLKWISTPRAGSTCFGKVYLLICPGSIDENVKVRLDEKMVGRTDRAAD